MTTSAEPIVYRAGMGTASGAVDADPITTEVIRHGLNTAAEQGCSCRGLRVLVTSLVIFAYCIPCTSP